MTMDILGNVLSRADNPAKASSYLTEELRELTGARCVLLVQHSGPDEPLARVVSINPERRRDWAESTGARQFYLTAGPLASAQVWRCGVQGAEGGAPLYAEGFDLSLSVPLRVGEFQVGLLLLLGLPDNPHLASEVELLTTLSTLIALVLRNGLLYERQEQTIQERTGELRASEERLRLATASSNTGLWEYNLQTGAVYLSPIWKRQIGYGETEIPSSLEEWLSRIHPDDLNRVNQQASQFIKSPRAGYETEFRLRHKNGSYRWILSKAAMEFDEAGRPRRMSGAHIDITERKHAEESTQASLQEKTVLLKEVHHRVKNNLQIIASLLNLQAARLKSPDVLAVLRDTQGRVYSMALLHESLYQSDNLARINSPAYFATLADQLWRAFQPAAGNIQVRTRIDNAGLGLEQAVPCGLIANELVTNALKHAFPTGRPGQILVELQPQGSAHLRLSVIDTGIGLPEGLPPSGSGTLGLRLVANLARQLRGEFSQQDNRPGAAFHVVFPITHPPAVA